MSYPGMKNRMQRDTHLSQEEKRKILNRFQRSFDIRVRCASKALGQPINFSIEKKDPGITLRVKTGNRNIGVRLLHIDEDRLTRKKEELFRALMTEYGMVY